MLGWDGSDVATDDATPRTRAGPPARRADAGSGPAGRRGRQEGAGSTWQERLAGSASQGGLAGRDVRPACVPRSEGRLRSATRLRGRRGDHERASGREGGAVRVVEGVEVADARDDRTGVGAGGHAAGDV